MGLGVFPGRVAPGSSWVVRGGSIAAIRRAPASASTVIRRGNFFSLFFALRCLRWVTGRRHAKHLTAVSLCLFAGKTQPRVTVQLAAGAGAARG